MKTLLRTAALLSIYPVMFACGDSTSPDSAAGSYTSLIFYVSDVGGGPNQAPGSTLDINLLPNGKTTGHLHIAATSSTAAVDADMAGTWTQNGDEVEFDQTADTFVRDMVFTIERLASPEPYQLVGDQVFGNTRINLTLVRN